MTTPNKPVEEIINVIDGVPKWALIVAFLAGMGAVMWAVMYIGRENLSAAIKAEAMEDRTDVG